MLLHCLCTGGLRSCQARAQDILNGGTLETGKRKAGLSDIQKPAKRARIYGFEDLSSSDSDNDSEYEAAARLRKAGQAASSSGDDSGLSAQESALEIAKAEPEVPSTSAAAATAEAPAPLLSAQHSKPSNEASTHTNQSAEAASKSDKGAQQPHEQPSVMTATAASALPIREQPSASKIPPSAESAAATDSAPIDLAKFSDAEQLETVGLERLKSELQRYGLKCGGNLKERAARLFLVKSTPVDKVDQQHFSKQAKKKQ